MPDNIVKLVEAELSDIPQLMETTAANIRDGFYGKVVSGAAVLIDDEGSLTVFGWGAHQSAVHSAGLFALATQWLAAHRTNRG